MRWFRRTGDVRRDLDRCLVKDRLLILHKRNHVGILGDVLVDRLPPGDTFFLVRLAPQGADHAIKIVGIPHRVGRWPEHGEARRRGRIANGIAPIVESGGGQRVTGAQLIMLGDFVDFDFRLDADLPPHADDGLDHFIILRLETARRLNLELHRIVRPEPRSLEKLGGLGGIKGRGDRSIEGGVLRGLQRVDGRGIATHQLFGDGLLVDRHDGRHAHVLVIHDIDVVEEDHADIGHRSRHASQALLALQPVEFLERHVDRHIRRTGFDFCHAARGVGHELVDHCIKSGLAAPIIGIGLQTHKGIALELVDHVGPSAHRLGFEAFHANFFIIGLGHHIAGEEGHPLEQRRLKGQYIGGDLVAIDHEVADLRPDEGNRVAAIHLAGAFERPHHVISREG